MSVRIQLVIPVGAGLIFEANSALRMAAAPKEIPVWVNADRFVFTRDIRFEKPTDPTMCYSLSRIEPGAGSLASTSSPDAAAEAVEAKAEAAPLETMEATTE